MEEVVVLGVFLLLALGAYWSLVIFPRQRDFQKQQRYVSELKPGDQMITYGGLVVRVIEIEPEQGLARVEIADGVVVRMIAAALIRPYDPVELADNARRGLGTPSEVK
jgi:preprotein translocase YajC subunit